MTPQPGAVAVTRYGKTYTSKPMELNMPRKAAIICNASISWRQSSPTLKMALCHTSYVALFMSFAPVLLSSEVESAVADLGRNVTDVSVR